MEFNGKKILVLGAAISGISVARILRGLGAAATLSDAKTADKLKHDISGLEAAGVGLALGHQDETLLDGVDILVLSPGVSVYIPLVAAAQKRGIVVMSEIEVAYRLCKAPIVAITGTNGKTTTTTLTGEILKAAGKEVAVGGNIGQALSAEVSGVSQAGVVVAEISSFQLEGAIAFKPHIAAILNLTPDHIDRHRDLATYKATKERVFANQTEQDYLILNYDDPAVRDMGQRAPSQVVYFSRLAKLPAGLFVESGMIKLAWQGETLDIIPVDDLKIPGAHNVENALAACAAAYFAGARPKDMAAVLGSFTGVEHRIEPVATVQGVTYYNDSKATNPESSIKALEAFPAHIILIAGGRDKNTDLGEFMSLAREKVDHLILLGEAAERFAAAAERHGVKNIRHVADFPAAVALAHSLARPPQLVLLSPACASYDMFNNYEERGRAFKDLVRRLS
ncbi:MAG TPA: UDP-N-acetylmuramoyl-L-alanine--D-glutamate ligase [Negativicutes bacterium]|nr:UDP-N-acetylmuramoyl-L-alanine--D-glutamate ligase [Negativicutes bacterium]